MQPNLNWWQTESIYQIFIKSFFDSNDDGIGDFRGIIQKLDYIKSLSCNIIWITPCFPSDGKDAGYDITNFYDVDPVYGTMDDFDELVRKVHEKNMYILLDFVPNHTSDQHEWFKESCKNKNVDNPYRDYYVWYESDDKINPPNNWISAFNGSMWTYCETRKAWYLHQFLKEQPDLNFRNPEVRKEIKEILRFWLEDKNIDGFRIDALKHLIESDQYENEPLRDDYWKHPHLDVNYDDIKHLYTTNQPETFELLLEWKQLFEEISQRTNKTKAFISEATYTVTEYGQYYLYKDRAISDFVLNFQLCISKKRFELKSSPYYFNAFNLKKLIEDYVNNLPIDSWTCWTTGNHDQSRVATRIGKEYINIMNVLNLLLGGTAVIYYGEEIGMEDLPRCDLLFEDCKDYRGIKYGPYKYLDHTRDLLRTPMQWNIKAQAGFSLNDQTYLPVNSNYSYLNVEDQLKNEKSYLCIFKDLMRLRRLPSFQWGKLEILLVNEHIFSFTRKADDHPVYLIIINLSDEDQTTNLMVNDNISSRAYVLYYISGTYNEINNNSYIEIITSENNDEDMNEKNLINKYKINSLIPTSNVKLNPYDCLILTLSF